MMVPFQKRRGKDEGRKDAGRKDAGRKDARKEGRKVEEARKVIEGR